MFSPRNFLKFLLILLGFVLIVVPLVSIGGADANRQAVPTPDRLAQPTLPASPSQADKGAQLYWLSCMPCHGDRGQGLTDEFREVYPPEDRNCWNSGCHGKRPYDHGFTLPTSVPALIGPGTLQKFSNAAFLRGYTYATMPYWKPASLTEDETWQVTAFLLRENGLWDAKEELNASNASQVMVSGQKAVFHPDSSLFDLNPFAVGLVVFILILFVQIITRKRTTS